MDINGWRRFKVVRQRVSHFTFAPEFIIEKLPDARGVFLRGMNAGRDSVTGNFSNRRVGSYQSDALRITRIHF